MEPGWRYSSGVFRRWLWNILSEPTYLVFKALFSFFFSSMGLFLFAYVWHSYYDMNTQVLQTFENPEPPSLIREGYHFARHEENEVRKAFLNQTDTLGLVGVVFGPAGTGKSNVVRTVCVEKRENQTEYKGVSGVIYMEIGSPRQFAYHLAKACGVPVEPSWYDAVVSKLFTSMRTSLTLPYKDEDALASVLPIIAKGGKEYKKKHGRIPVLFIDGADILAKQKDRSLYTNLVDWAKKCANEDSLQIVLVSSDSHVLALDQQSFKSRLADLIEVNDINREQAVQLMTHKYHFDEYFAELIYDRLGGRLADIHKVVALWRKNTDRKISRKVIAVTKDKLHLPKQELEHAIFTALGANENGSEDTEDRSNDLSNEERYLTLAIMRQYEWLKTCDSARIPIEVANAVNKMEAQPSNEQLRGIVLTALKGRVQLPTEDRSDALKDGTVKCTIKAILHEWIWWNEFSGEIKRQFVREMEQAFCKVLGNDKGGWKLKVYIINSVLEMKETKTVEDIAVGYAKKQGSSTQEVIEAIQDFLDNNVLRITKYRTLFCYNKMAEEVLRSFKKETDNAETERQERIETKEITGKLDRMEGQDGTETIKKQPEDETVDIESGTEETEMVEGQLEADETKMQVGEESKKLDAHVAKGQNNTDETEKKEERSPPERPYSSNVEL